MDEETFQFWVMSMLGSLCVHAATMEKRYGNENLAETLTSAAKEARDYLIGLQQAAEDEP